MENKQIDKFFNPQTIAVIGANDRENSAGFSIFKNIKSSFKGKVYPVNNSADIIQGEKAYPSVSELPEKIDLAIIATPAPTVLGLVEECGKAGIDGVVIISSGFLEAGDSGKELFIKIKETGTKYGIKILGPNCLGFINPRLLLNASFAPSMPNSGGIAFISQSGALCNTFLDWSINDRIGYSYFVSIGSMVDIGFDELIDYFNGRPEVNSILLYMESVNDAKKFMEAVRNFSQKKPIVVLKAGIGIQGAKAVASHTGTIAGDDRIFDAVFKKIGAIRVNTINELYNYAKILNRYKKASGNRLAIVTNAGGPAVIATDYLIGHGGNLAKISNEDIKKLNETMPPAWSKGNPIDILGDAGPRHYQSAVEMCLKNPDIDGIMLILTPQAITDTEGIAKAIISLPKIETKPVFASFMGEHLVRRGVDILLESGIPVFRTPEQAIRCFLELQEWQNNSTKASDFYKTDVSGESHHDKHIAEKIIGDYQQRQQFIITGGDTLNLIASYGIPVNPMYKVKTKKEATKIADKMGYPVAMKVEIEGLLHKTDIGGVRLNIQDAKEVGRIFNKLSENSEKIGAIKGITVEKMVTKKYELFVGSKKDSLFGPVIVFGTGGVGVEVYNDTAIGLLPINMASAGRLIDKTKIGTLLRGYRNQKSANIQSIRSALVKLSSLILDFPQIKEVDINPLFADEDGIIAVDAKIILEK